MKKLALTVLAFVVATFATQAPSHYLVFADHYDAVTYIRSKTLFQYGVLAMVIEGVVLSALYTRFAGSKSTTKSALGFSYLMGAFLVSYTAFGEAAKYMVPSVASWIAVEVGVGLVQYTVSRAGAAAVRRRAPTASHRQSPSRSQIAKTAASAGLIADVE